MTYFPLRQTTCFFIPLVAPCKPLLPLENNNIPICDGKKFEIIKKIFKRILRGSEKWGYIKKQLK